MTKKLTALRVIALLGAMSSASLLLAGGPAHAAQERLHSETTVTYGLIPPNASGASKTEQTKDHGPAKRVSVAAAASKSASKGGHASKGHEPKIEDPPLPGYDGNTPAAAAGKSSSRGKKH
ncbi:MAG: hypothetical protein NTZ54_02445 [Alphaproteobacteria bacterium]|nr:hypothetical protein [Alphaproteobacteria bacterium]